MIFEERGKPEYPGKNLSEQGEYQQQTQPTYDAETESRTRATLVGGKFSHHYTTPLQDKLRQLPKRALKNPIRNMLVSIMKAEGDSVEVPIPLQKIANCVA